MDSTGIRVMECGYRDPADKQRATATIKECNLVGTQEHMFSSKRNYGDYGIYTCYTCVRTDYVASVTDLEYKKIEDLLIQRGFVKVKLPVPPLLYETRDPIGYYDMLWLKTVGPVFRLPPREGCADAEFTRTELNVR